MKLNKIILFASASLLMTSCGIYNKYERPEVNTKGLVPAAAVAHREGHSQQYQYAQCCTQRKDG